MAVKKTSYFWGDEETEFNAKRNIFSACASPKKSNMPIEMCFGI